MRNRGSHVHGIGLTRKHPHRHRAADCNLVLLLPQAAELVQRVERGDDQCDLDQLQYALAEKEAERESIKVHGDHGDGLRDSGESEQSVQTAAEEPQRLCACV